MEVSNIQANTGFVRNTVSDKTGDNGKESVTRENGTKEDSQVVNGTINANELNLAGLTDTQKKKLLAQKAAIQTVLDQFNQETSLDDAVNNHAKSRDTYQENAKNYQNEVSELNDLKKELKDNFGVEDDSEEQKNLELMEKKLKGTTPLTKEEQEQLKNMGPLTEYQEAALKYDSMAAVWQDRADEARDNAINESRTIEAIKLARLKTHPMYDAKKDAEEILKLVDDEIQQQITEDAKETIDEKQGMDKEDDMLTNIQTLLDKHVITEEDIKGLLLDQKL